VQRLRVAASSARRNTSNSAERTDGYRGIEHADQLELDSFDR
jgi:hypothetical protein